MDSASLLSSTIFKVSPLLQNLPGSCLDIIDHFSQRIHIQLRQSQVIQTVMALQELPGTQLLGYGLNMTTLSPINIDAVHSSILHARRFIDLQEQTNQHLVGSTTYSVPKNVHVNNALKVQSGYRIYESGKLAVISLQNDMSLASSFFAVSLNASTSNLIRKSFQDTSQYALYNHNSSHYSIFLRNYSEHLNEGNLKRSIMTLPRPFSPSVNTINRYKAFFATFGSHNIIGATYGARLQISASSSSQDSEIRSHFSAYVNAAFNGVLSSGEFDVALKQSDHYQSFYASMEKTVAVRGGDEQLAILLARNPSDLDTYHRWASTHLQRPDLVGIQTQEIWYQMQCSSDAELIDAAPSVQEAYEYIVNHPMPHMTHAQVTIYSDWGGFGLLSPEATAVEDPNARKDYPGSANFSSKSVYWNDKTNSIATISFFISNDGSPVHFYTSHGNGGPGKGYHKGKIEVVINGKEYMNNDITGDGVNTKSFYNCPVVGRNE